MLNVKAKQLLKAAYEGPFFRDNAVKNDPYWEYPSLFGVTGEQMRQLLEQEVTEEGRDEYISLCESIIGHMVGYPIAKEEELVNWLGVDRSMLADSKVIIEI